VFRVKLEEEHYPEHDDLLRAVNFKIKEFKPGVNLTELPMAGSNSNYGFKSFIYLKL